MAHTNQSVPGGSVNTDELITDFAFFHAVIDKQESFDFEKERMELFGFID
jgi:hypothetical protein